MARRVNRREEGSSPAWFAPKTYGYGAGLPIAWQGWALIAVYMAIMLGAAAAFHREPLIMAAIAIPVSVALLLIAARTTRGGWRWRWGKED